MSKREKEDEVFECEEKPDVDLAVERSNKGMRSYWLTNNKQSLDGLPGVLSAPYVPAIPRSEWTLEKERKLVRPREVKALEVKRQSTSQLHPDAKVVTAFALGVLVAALSFTAV